MLGCANKPSSTVSSRQRGNTQFHRTNAERCPTALAARQWAARRTLCSNMGHWFALQSGAAVTTAAGSARPHWQGRSLSRPWLLITQLLLRSLVVLVDWLPVNLTNVVFHLKARLRRRRVHGASGPPLYTVAREMRPGQACLYLWVPTLQNKRIVQRCAEKDGPGLDHSAAERSTADFAGSPPIKILFARMKA